MGEFTQWDTLDVEGYGEREDTPAVSTAPENFTAIELILTGGHEKGAALEVEGTTWYRLKESGNYWRVYHDGELVTTCNVGNFSDASSILGVVAQVRGGCSPDSDDTDAAGRGFE